MIKKEVLLKKLVTLISMEEAIVPYLRDQLSSAIAFGGFDKAQTEEFQQQLQQLADREQKHIAILTELITDINQKEDKTF